ncbi:ABC transporter substrate-binding protein [Nocardia sp. alder85J]|uniref:ABC transporter substrate-binding protein n=1 Tax=Nocardia sp. alder85J TaxID=2862949 RepID=UPI001CD50EBD|nr:ABC transporter substrate-binding protein [Nocardia sp. alder85J]MCX4091544.1 ABC transporter substrate-binding protein [Nocardia sp. alder85J]
MIRHWPARAAAAAATLLTLTACSVGAPSSAPSTSVATVPELTPDQKVSITFESYNLSTAGPWTDTFNELLDNFRKQHPNIAVTAQKPGGASANGVNNAMSSLQTEVAGGNAPTVAQETFGDLDFMVDKLHAHALDDLVGKDAVQANFGGAHPFADTAKTLGDWKGKTYGVPFVFSTPVLYYNASMFRAAGLDPADPPATWDQVKTAAQAIKSHTGKDGVYIDCLTKVSGDWCYQALVASNGGSVLSGDGSTLTFADAPAVEAVAMARDLVGSGVMPQLTQVQAFPQFAAGNIGMFLESSSLQGNFVKGAADGHWDLAAATMPKFGDKPTAPTNSGAALFVTAGDPAQQRAGWELIKYLTSDEAYSIIARKIGYLPLRTGLVDDPNSTLASWVAQNPLVRPNLDQLKRLHPWLAFPGDNYVQIRNGMLEAVEKSVFQNADPAATLTAAQQQVAALMPAK